MEAKKSRRDQEEKDEDDDQEEEQRKNELEWASPYASAIEIVSQVLSRRGAGRFGVGIQDRTITQQCVCLSDYEGVTVA